MSPRQDRPINSIDIIAIGSTLEMHMNGVGLTKLPECIGQLTIIKKLDLSNNVLIDLPYSIGQLSIMDELNLRNNKLMKLPSSFDKLIMLRRLDLSNNKFKTVPSILEKLENITLVELSGNDWKFGRSFFGRELKLINNYPTLNSLLYQFVEDLHLLLDRPLRLETFFPKLILNSVAFSLTYYNLSTLPDSIGRLLPVTELDLSNNNFTMVPKSIFQLENLVKLNLGRNRLMEMPDLFTYLPKLQELNLNSNNLTELADSLSSLSNLYKIDIGSNDFEDYPDTIISRLIERGNVEVKDYCFENNENYPRHEDYKGKMEQFMKELRSLIDYPINIDDIITHHENELSINLSGYGLTEIPHSLTLLTPLTDLDLRNNKLSWLPDSFSELDYLRSIDISRNRFEEFPPEISYLRAINNVILFENRLFYQIQSKESIYGHYLITELAGFLIQDSYIIEQLFDEIREEYNIYLDFFVYQGNSRYQYEEDLFVELVFANEVTDLLVELILIAPELEFFPKSIFKMKRLRKLQISISKDDKSIELPKELENMESLTTIIFNKDYG